MEEYLQYMKTLRSQMNGTVPLSLSLSLYTPYFKLQRRSVTITWNKYIKIDVEDQAAKISVEEQMQLTSIQTMEKDLDSG